MATILNVIAWISSVVVLYRLRKYFVPARLIKADSSVHGSYKVSVIIPARNEEHNIQQLLRSLMHSSIQPHEIIVVDDNSIDKTVSVAAQFNVKILSAGKRPEGWAGKNWACHVGVQAASGEYLLFTDADTAHNSSGLLRALRFIDQHQGDMLSSPFFHRNELWWEKLLGPFHCLIHCGASPFDKQTSDFAYAVGQYILIKTEMYKACDGHFGVRSEVAEDAALAKSVMKHGGRYLAYAESPLFTVQMYKSFLEFCRGWVRLLRLGMRQFSFEISFNSLLPLLAMNFSRLYPPSFVAYVPLVIILCCFAFVQRRLGNFSMLGILFFPVSVVLFLTLSLHAVALELLNAPIAWKGRRYETANDVS